MTVMLPPPDSYFSLCRITDTTRKGEHLTIDPTHVVVAHHDGQLSAVADAQPDLDKHGKYVVRLRAVVGTDGQQPTAYAHGVANILAVARRLLAEHSGKQPADAT